MENNFEHIKQNSKEKPIAIGRRNFLKSVGAASAGLLLSEMPAESIFSQERERTIGRTKETRGRLASTRERKAFKIVNLDQILETIRKTNEEHAYFKTNLNKQGEYYKYPGTGNVDNIPINSDNFPLEEGVNQVTIAHTHRIHGSIREQFRTMPPYPPSVTDWQAVISKTEKLSEKNIKFSAEIIELNGIWAVDFQKTEKTEEFIKFSKEEWSLRYLLLPLQERFGDNFTFINLIHYLRGTDTNSKEFEALWQYEAFRDTILTCQKINSKLKEKYPEVFLDLKKISEIQAQIMATTSNNDRNRRSEFVEEYAAVAAKYGFKVEYNPFNPEK